MRLPIVVSEIQTGGVADTKAEFIELYNPNSEPVTVDGMQLQYYAADRSLLSGPTRIIAMLSGEIDAYTFVVFAYSGYFTELIPLPVPFASNASTGSLAQTGGALRLAHEDGTVEDSVGWGASTLVYESSLAAGPSVGNSIQRCFDSADTIIDTNNNADDYAQYTDTSPGFGLICPPPIEPDPTGDPAEPSLSCEGVVLSEVLPNAAGSDTGREFIELYNPTTDIINLAGCSLHLQNTSKTFVFAQQILDSGTYIALSDVQTGLTLPNAGGGTVWLVSAVGVELDVAAYPSDMVDDTAWAFVNGIWQVTYAYSPGAANIAMPLKPCAPGQFRDEATLQCRTVSVTAANTLTPCREGQERNPETNRCRAVVSSEGLVPCKEGQERNPETNRCRSVLGASTSLVPCESDEERNPDTNRCRKIANASTLSPCATGQERNPETNRCRKVVIKGADLDQVKDIQSDTQASLTSWFITGAVLLAALAYALYEWRQDIAQRLRWLRRD